MVDSLSHRIFDVLLNYGVQFGIMGHEKPIDSSIEPHLHFEFEDVENWCFFPT